MKTISLRPLEFLRDCFDAYVALAGNDCFKVYLYNNQLNKKCE
jgi:hypothetical protein